MKHIPLICAASMLLATHPLHAADVADLRQASAAKVFTDRQGDTIRVSVTRKESGKDTSFEITAVSLDGKGLLVTSLQALEKKEEPPSMVKVSSGDEEDETSGAPKKAKGELTRVAMLKPDATESEADLVLTDAALDLALIRVRPEGATGLAAPKAAKAAPGLLEPLVAIDREGADFQRTATTSLSEISALITTPRSLYLTAQPFSPGAAVYNLSGEWLGLVTNIHDTPVVVPAATILKFANGASKQQPSKP